MILTKQSIIGYNKKTKQKENVEFSSMKRTKYSEHKPRSKLVTHRPPSRSGHPAAAG